MPGELLKLHGIIYMNRESFSFWPLLLVVTVLVGVALLLMCVRVIFKKNGRFSQGHACRMHSTPPPLPKNTTKTKTKTSQHKS